MEESKKEQSIEEILGKAGFISPCCDGSHYDIESYQARKLLEVAQLIYNIGYEKGRKDKE